MKNRLGSTVFLVKVGRRFGFGRPVATFCSADGEMTINVDEPALEWLRPLVGQRFSIAIDHEGG